MTTIEKIEELGEIVAQIVKDCAGIENRLKIIEIELKSRDKKSPPGTKSPQIKSENESKSGLHTNVQQFKLREFSKIALATKTILDYEFIPETPLDSRWFISTMRAVKFVKIAIKGMMSDPRNHNFWLASRRYYVYVGEQRWDEVTSTVFFKEIREKIWRFYRITVCRYLSDNQCEFVDVIRGRIMAAAFMWTNVFLSAMLEPYKPLLLKQFKLRVRKLIKVI